ncbi:hypothetical protein MKW98_023063, partial [Papaver atlanticum]
ISFRSGNKLKKKCIIRSCQRLRSISLTIALVLNSLSFLVQPIVNDVCNRGDVAVAQEQTVVAFYQSSPSAIDLFVWGVHFSSSTIPLNGPKLYRCFFGQRSIYVQW